ncbi:MAG: prolyl oligopeptidase family serine peptidase [Wenzhouxiangellaceae bacterium]
MSVDWIRVCLFMSMFSTPALALEYPETRRGDQVDDYHGTKVADPYRWLEADVRETPAVAEWVAAQNAVTDAYLETLEQRDQIRPLLTKLWDYERFGVPVRAGERYFFTRNDGLQNQSVLYVQDGPEGEPKVLIDPNQWADDGTVALAQWVPSPQGRYLAYGIQDGGSDWRLWRILDVASGRILDEELRWLKFTSVSWTPDESGFYYSRYPQPAEGETFQSLNLNMKVYHHQIGQPQSADRLVHEDPQHPEWGYAAEVTDDGRYLVVTVWQGTDDRYQIMYRDLRDDTAQLRYLIEGFESAYELAGNQGETLFFRTTNQAQRYRVIAINPAQPQPRHWREVVPQSQHVLQAAVLFGGHLLLEYLEDAKSALQIHDLQGTLEQRVDLPGLGSVGALSGSEKHDEAFFAFSSFNRPDTIYRLQMESGKADIFKAPELSFDPDRFVVRQVFYRSKDGTRVPMFLAHRKDLSDQLPAPTMLYAYGGFNISLTPSFSPTRLAWLELGGVYAVANLRGGGEYGEAWHKAGTKLNKQNVFDDFIAAGEYLVKEGITQPQKLAIFGGSNGGLLVGAVTNQRPDLFAAAVPAVGVMDMLRFQHFTAGRFWVDDYGSSADAAEFKALYAYSPYHNVKAGTEYPAVMVTTADFDDRVVPGHSFKYIAALQQAQAGDEPVLIRIETRAGHGAGKPTEKVIDEYTDVLAFFAEHTGLATKR